MSHRHARVEKELRTRIAEVLQLRARDPRLVGVQIVEVRASADFSYARVFFRTPGAAADVLEALQKAKGFVRSKLAAGMKIRRIPELDFRFDESPERAARVYELLEGEEGTERDEGGAA